MAPADLGSFAAPLPAGRTDRPPLYTELAAVVGPLYDVAGSPPARAAALAAALPEDGVVVARPGLLGFWLARTFPTAARAACASRTVGTPTVTEEDWAEVDLDPSALVAVAGPIVAWGGIDA